MRLTKLLLLLIIGLSFGAPEASAQVFGKKKKKMSSVGGFTVQEALTPEERKKAMERQLVSPVRKFINRFNFNIEKSYGYFSYKSELTDVSVVRNPRGDLLYIVPLGEETSPSNAFSNWMTDLTPITINRIDDDSQIVRTDTTSFIYSNNGRYNPLSLRVSFSLKKVDKTHLETTGEKRYLEEDLLRIGGGIGWGKMKFRNPASTQDVDPFLRNYTLPEQEISTTKMYGSITYNAYSLGDFAILADVQGGVWKTKTSQLNQELVTYDPFFNVGVMFQRSFSKYFKGYIRPSVEMRSYTIANEQVSVPHNFTIFSIDFGLLLKYPTYPRNKYKAHMVQMEHVFNGKMYRGRPFYRKQNPRYGQRRNSKKEPGSSFSIRKDKKGDKGND
ncbi:hypothetical protein [Roseivirga pacifica]|uniref:hypothetical protein n=1 Tax=Roseivirga pacifica TaxID=1267423 RepID=UPI0020961175|nr:hypothetical protein [Roseivirga pacifica]MCO6360638.1 hypothetical protein [Roseivirga pacifica]MCO6368527.1 hypothetical protein [Roseivirga pacifica]MCO6372669.1 hypothetical protein [Roseivirga pacifica]MCO6376727.1 hypothetical protein [Roseivirga pacifica]MCO6377993.1 hypothetical protein [Roseivirga pacifica]